MRAVVGGSARLTPARTLDIAGTGLSAAALLALLLALSRGNDAGWATPSTVALYAAAAAGLLLFVWHETRTPEPLLDPAWFRDRSFAGANLQIRRRNRSSPSSALV